MNSQRGFPPYLQKHLLFLLLHPVFYSIRVATAHSLDHDNLAPQGTVVATYLLQMLKFFCIVIPTW